MLGCSWICPWWWVETDYTEAQPLLTFALCLFERIFSPSLKNRDVFCDPSRASVMRVVSADYLLSTALVCVCVFMFEIDGNI